MKLALFALVLATACSKKAADDGKVASCYAESAQSCVEYRGGNLALGTESLQKLCTVVVSTAKFSETACPTAKVIGVCQRNEGKDFYYEGHYIAATDIEARCKAIGGTYATK
jgi:hypothetical protein